MEGVIYNALTQIISGGQGSVIALLIIVILVLAFVIKTMYSSTKQEHEEVSKHIESDRAVILSIIDKYHGGNLQMVHALNEIKIVLTSIQERVR